MSTPVRYRAKRFHRCANCSILLPPHLRRHAIEDLNKQLSVLLQSWISPTPISSDGVLCIKCYKLLQERMGTIGSPEDPSPAVYGHCNVCFACGISTSNRKTHRVPLECPQRIIILKLTPLHLVSRLEKVCYACWLVASRKIKRYALQNNIKQENIMETVPSEIDCSIIPEPPQQPLPNQMPHIKHENIMETVPSGFEDAMIHEQQAPSLLSQTPPIKQEKVWEIVPKELESTIITDPLLHPLESQTPQTQLSHQKTEPKIHSKIYKRVTAGSRYCMFDGCRNKERLLVPTSVKDCLLLKFKIYVPINARICHFHLNNKQWDKLVAKFTDFTSNQVDEIFKKLERYHFS